MNILPYTKTFTAGCDAPLKVQPGHFATNHAHLNYYFDVTTLKTRSSEARDIAKAMALLYLNDMVIDTIICMEGTEVIGAYLAEELKKRGFWLINGGQLVEREIYELM